MEGVPEADAVADLVPQRLLARANSTGSSPRAKSAEGRDWMKLVTYVGFMNRRPTVSGSHQGKWPKPAANRAEGNTKSSIQ